MEKFQVKKRSFSEIITSTTKAETGWGYKTYWLIISLSRSTSFFRILIDSMALVFYKLFRSGKTFIFRSKSYKYFYHAYNRTVASERVVEIPIANEFLKQYEGKMTLEVGNVMPHYFSTKHDVLDKYEKGEGVINKDVVDFKANKKYDLIISVSTMEHVGYSYGEAYDPTKFTKGIANLKKHLKAKGLLVVTFSLFYNKYLTELIAKKKSPFNKEFFMKRTSFWNEWEEVSRKEAFLGQNYDEYYANSNILYIGIFNRPA